jgi:hypothetical protein
LENSISVNFNTFAAAQQSPEESAQGAQIIADLQQPVVQSTF